MICNSYVKLPEGTSKDGEFADQNGNLSGEVGILLVGIFGWQDNQGLPNRKRDPYWLVNSPFLYLKFLNDLRISATERGMFNQNEELYQRKIWKWINKDWILPTAGISSTKVTVFSRHDDVFFSLSSTAWLVYFDFLFGSNIWSEQIARIYGDVQEWSTSKKWWISGAKKLGIFSKGLTHSHFPDRSPCHSISRGISVVV